jgi:thiamine-phosphate diphosphorylase
VPFCINDRLDVALAVGADAVHLGQDDLPISAALQVLRGRNKPLLLGVSTHNLAQAKAAVAAGADYIGFGPVFPTRSSETRTLWWGLPRWRKSRGPCMYRWWRLAASPWLSLTPWRKLGRRQQP